MRILLTNNTLDGFAGTEVFTRDLAIALMRRGHQPVAYSSQLGPVAGQLRAATVPVVDDLTTLAEPPEIIHGHHHYDTLAAILQFPAAPALYFCHGWLPWQEAPLLHPRIYRYAAVDELCRERLMVEGGIPRETIELVLNYYNAEHFPARTDPLPAKPRRALAFANEFSESRGLPVLREACQRAGIELDAIGLQARHWQARPGDLLGGYDIVFAKARSALEAMASGAAVVLCTPDRIGPMVNRANFPALRPLNFGIRTLTEELSVDRALARLNAYDAQDAVALSAQVRQSCELQGMVDRLLEVYGRILDQARERPAFPSASSEAAASRYLQQQAFRLKRIAIIDQEREIWKQRAETAERLGQNYASRLENCRSEDETALRARCAELEAHIEVLGRRTWDLEQDLAAVRGSLSWRLSQAVLSPLRRFTQRRRDERS